MRFWVGPTNVPPPRTARRRGSLWLWTRPPTRSRASSTTTDFPAFAISRAAVSPARPAPTTTTSARRTLAPGFAFLLARLRFPVAAAVRVGASSAGRGGRARADSPRRVIAVSAIGGG